MDFMANPFFDLLAKATANARVPRMFPGGEESTNVNAPQDYLAEARRYIETSPQGAPYRNPFLYYNAETMQGQPTFWGRHPRVTNALESVLTTLGSMGPTGATTGENISNVARGLVAYPQLRAQHEQQQLMAPYQLASSMMGMQKTQAEIRKQQADAELARAHGQAFLQHGNLWEAQAANYAKSVEARLVAAYGRANLRPVLNEQGQLQGYNVLTPSGIVFHSAMPQSAPMPTGSAPAVSAAPEAPTTATPVKTPTPGLYTESSYRASKGGNLWAGSTSVVISKLHAAGMHDMARDLEATALRLVAAGAAGRAAGEGKIPEREKLTFQSYAKGIDDEIRATEAEQAAFNRTLTTFAGQDALRQRRAARERGETVEPEPDFDTKLKNLRDARASLVGAFSAATKPAGSPIPEPAKVDTDPLGIFK